jgi:hypothetical protein
MDINNGNHLKKRPVPSIDPHLLLELFNGDLDCLAAETASTRQFRRFYPHLDLFLSVQLAKTLPVFFTGLF